jgi:tyrosinase
MVEPQNTRREFLKQTGALSATCFASALVGRSRADQPNEPLKRQSIVEFSKDERRLASFRAGVQRMRDLEPDHPFSWIFQANIHNRPFYPGYVYTQAGQSRDPAARLFRDKLGFSPDPGPFGFSFSQCPHSNWWFLPWHRAYLYYFERILRWAANDTTLTLPYWNYSDPEQRELPKVFRDRTVNGQPNALYLPESAIFKDDQGNSQIFPMRDGPLNRGLTQLTSSATSLNALKIVPFTNSAPAPANQAFGSARACDTTCACASGAVESIPHNVVHNAIGGSVVTTGAGFRVGFMGDITTAARDPIFWLHHSNIDRLWESWVQLNQGRQNPDDSDWLDYPFAFYDVGEDKQPQPATITPRNILSTQQLGYVYDHLEKPPAILASDLPTIVPVVSQVLRPLAATPAPKPSMMPPSGQTHAGMALAGIQLKNSASQTIALPLAPGLTPAQFRAALTSKAEGKGDLILALEGVEFEQMPGVYYEVYLGLPKDEKPNSEGPYYLGSLTLFGLKHHGPAQGHGAKQPPRTVSFAIPSRLRKMIDEEKLKPEELKVTFVPQTGTEPIKKGLELKPAPERTAVTIKQIRLLLIR